MSTQPIACHNPFGQFEDLFGQVSIRPERLSRVKDRMTGWDRHYHGLFHLALMWTMHKGFRRGTKRDCYAREFDRKIACAIAYHDAVYDGTSKNNEADSADLWRSDAIASGIPNEAPPGAGMSYGWADKAIRATADHFGSRGSGDQALDWFLDLDLISLAAEPDIFDTNAELLRLEYRHLSREQWNLGRMAFLDKALSQTKIFHSDLIHHQYEARARGNLERCLKNIAQDPQPCSFATAIV